MADQLINVKRYDRGTLQRPLRLDNGFLRVDAYLTRTGVFEYMNQDGTIRRELRTPEEVFHKDAMASLDRAPVCVDHPREGHINSKNRRALSVGTSGSIRQDGEFVAGSLQIEDADAVNAVERGKREISCGYSADLEMKSGVSEAGERYDCIQKNIRYNHVALVALGRAGPSVRVRMDSLDAEIVDSTNDALSAQQENHVDEIEIDMAGVKVKVPKTVAALHEKERKDSADALDATKAKLDAANEALAQAKKAHADAADPKRFDEAVKSRVSLESKAREILGAEQEIKGSDRDVRIAVITKLAPTFKADGLSDEYVRARYDGALEHAAQNTVDEARRQTTYIPASGAQHADSEDSWNVLQKAKEDFAKRNSLSHVQKKN